PASLGMASAYVNLGKEQEALSIYRRLATTVPEAKRMATRLLIRRNINSKSIIPADWEEVDRFLDELSSDGKKGKTEDIRLRADSLMARQQFEGARKLLQEAKDRQPKEVAYWIAWAALLEQQGNQVQQVLSCLDEAEQKLGDRVELRVARARFW